MLHAIAASLVLAAPLRVAVTGAGGQTGQLAFRKMLARPDDFSPLGIVRTETSRSALVDSGIPADCVVVADVTDAGAVATAMKGCDALIIGTSAKPAPTGAMDEATGRPLFSYPNGEPEVVDWLGQKAQIDAAKACGDGTHVVICSSMGGTDPSNMLNALGRVTNDDGTTTGGNILLWKRKAEKYLSTSLHADRSGHVSSQHVSRPLTLTPRAQSSRARSRLWPAVHGRPPRRPHQ